MGVDTVKLSYPLGDGRRLYDALVHECDTRGRPVLRIAGTDLRSGPYDHGQQGPVRFLRFSDGGTGAEGEKSPALAFTVKGVSGSCVALLWEGSLPKQLGVHGPCPGDCVGVWDRHIRGILREAGLYGVSRPRVRRADLTHDVHDPDGLLRKAALDWNPHARSRYVQARYEDDETVWQHNKTRGVRVYDKYAESGEAWAVGLTRVEYQIRGAWIDKYGIAVDCDWDGLEERVLMPLVEELEQRMPLRIGALEIDKANSENTC